jgi:hypothetical protein
MARWKGTTTQRNWQRYARKGTTKQRGYAGQHPKLRAQWKPVVQAGRAYCHAVVCLMPDRWIPPDRPGQPTGWHLGHTPDRQAWTGPEHARCNEADGARRRNQAHHPWPRQQPARWITSRRW